MRARDGLAAAVVALVSVGGAPPTRSAQPTSGRLAILVAEDRRAPMSGDLAAIRAGLHAGDPETVQIAVRAIGRLERPELIPDIAPLLGSALPEIRAEAATAVGQAAQGWKSSAGTSSPGTSPASSPRSGLGGRSRGRSSRPKGLTLDATADLVTGRLRKEADPVVRAVLCDTIGRLPYTRLNQVERAETALIEASTLTSSNARVGVAQGLEALIRLHRHLGAPFARAVDLLEELARPDPTLAPTDAHPKDARIRRLALEALIATGHVASATIVQAASDPDAQVRRLALRAAGLGAAADLNGGGEAKALAGHDVLSRGLEDPSPLVRIEALRAGFQQAGVNGAGPPDLADRHACEAALRAANDPNDHVALTALDQLAHCPASRETALLFGQLVAVPAGAPAHAAVSHDAPASARGWHRPAHAIVALASVDPEGARAALPAFLDSPIWQVRAYAGRAAAILGDRAALQRLARAPEDNVCEVALEGLAKLGGRDAADLYIAALDRRGYQVLRAASLALQAAGPPAPAGAVAALEAALRQLVNAGRDNSYDARLALVDALEALGAHPNRAAALARMPIASALNASDLRRLASARARVVMHGLGTFELALFTNQAPATVLRFARLAESGYYNGLTFHRIVPNFVIQGGSPAANEYVGDAAFMRDEVGVWPHVRGAAGISTRGRDTGDGQLFIDLVDNPRLDHAYTVFAQVVAGLDVVDAILEGDTIETIEIVAAPQARPRGSAGA